jgi:hypothetical protein
VLQPIFAVASSANDTWGFPPYMISRDCYPQGNLTCYNASTGDRWCVIHGNHACICFRGSRVSEQCPTFNILHATARLIYSHFYASSPSIYRKTEACHLASPSSQLQTLQLRKKRTLSRLRGSSPLTLPQPRFLVSCYCYFSFNSGLKPLLGSCLAAATASAPAIFMHLCTNNATP